MNASDPQPPHGGRGGTWWDNAAEQRLNFVMTRLQEVTASLGEVAKELRNQTRQSDIHSSALERVNERLRDCEKALEALPNRLERLASAEWMTRLDTRINNFEDDAKSPFVRKGEFNPVRNVVFGLVALLCTGILGAVTRLIMK